MIRQVDIRLFQRFATLPDDRTARALRLLSRVADHGKLWVAVAVGVSVLGGERGRRASSRGLVATAVASGVTNQFFKRVARRGRPSTKDLDPRRLLKSQPLSFSFPSGHTASAFAFAVGAGREFPQAAIPLLALATTVGVSRVTVGAHYPGDVIVGAAAGATIAFAIRRVWLAADVASDWATHPTLHWIPAKPLARGEGLVVAVNPNAGAGAGEDAAGIIETELPGARVVIAERGEDLIPQLMPALDGASVVGVAGGDGSANSVAAVALDRELPLAVIPSGTLNHLAHDLGLEEPSDALEAVRSGHYAGVDVATIANRPFMNTASLGLYAELVRVRERLEPRIGKWPAAMLALLWTLGNGKPVDLEIDGQPRRVWIAYFGNCVHHPIGFAPLRRERLDDGVIDVRVLYADIRWSRCRAVVATLLNRLSKSRAYAEWRCSNVQVVSHHGALQLSADGEVFQGPAAFDVEKSGRQLVVAARRAPFKPPALASV